MVAKTVLTDIEFDKNINEIMDHTVVNTSAAKEHVADIERCICTVKERSHAVVSTLPFQYLHKLIGTNIFILKCFGSML